MVIEYLQEFGQASPKDIDSLLHDKFTNILEPEQKKNKVKNLLQEMAKKDETIRNTGGGGNNARWELN